MSTSTIAKVFSIAVPRMQRAVERAGDCVASDESRLTAASDFAETLAGLGPHLESDGEDLGELLGLLGSAVAALPDLAERGDAEAAVQVLELLALMEAYLEEPDDREIVEALLEIATSDVFDPPLSPEVAARWLTALDEEAASPEEQTWADGDSNRAASAKTSKDEPGEGRAETTGLDGGPCDAPEELTDEALELLAILSAAFEDMSEELDRCIDDIGYEDTEACRVDAASAIQEILMCLADAASEAGFLSFSTFCASFGYKLAAMPSEERWARAHLAELKRLSGRIQHYLFDPLNEATRAELIELLCASYWNEPLSEQDAADLIEGLRREPLMVEAEGRPERARRIADEDLALELADDVDASVIATFRREGPELARRLVLAVQRLLAGDGGEDAVRQAQRLAHTLKGSAGVCGVRAIVVLGHQMEDLLEFLAEEGLAPGAAFGDVLAAGADGLAGMLEVINGTRRYDPDASRSIMQAVLDWANRIDREGSAALVTADLGAASAPAARSVAAEVASHRQSDDTDLDQQVLQIPARAIHELLDLVGQLSAAVSQSEEQLGQVQRALSEVRELERRNRHHVAVIEKLVDLRGLGARGGVPPSAPPEEPPGPSS